MLHKTEEWNLIGRVPKFKLLTEQGCSLRLDDDFVSAGSWAGDLKRSCSNQPVTDALRRTA